MRLISYNHERLQFLISKDELSYQKLQKNLATMGYKLGHQTIRSHACGRRNPSAEVLAWYANLFCVPVGFFYEVSP